jgi:cell wall-associated NlpC family hydrolase
MVRNNLLKKSMRLRNKVLIIIGSLFGYLFATNCFAAESSSVSGSKPYIESATGNAESGTLQDKLTAVTESAVNNSQPNDAIGEILIQAMSLMGISYKWGGNTPETGMDCSGFIRYVFKKAMGINLPRTANEMSKIGIRVSVADMKPGDLIFFNTLRGRRNSHLGMYIGNNQFIQSPHTGERIQITEYNDYWRGHTNGVKRIVAEDDNSSGTVETFEDVTNQALPGGYMRGKHRLHRGHRHNARKISATKSSHPQKVKAKKVAKRKKVPQ